MSAPSTVPLDLNGDGFHDFRAVQTGRDSIRFERWMVDRSGLGSWEPTWLDPEETYRWLVGAESAGAVPIDNPLRRWLTERAFPAGDPVIVVDPERSPYGAAPGVGPWFPGLDSGGRPRPATVYGPLAGLGGSAGLATPVDRTLSARLERELAELQRTVGGQAANWTNAAIFRFQDHRAFRSLSGASKQQLEGLLRTIATYPASEGWTAVVNLARLLEEGSLGDDWGAALLWELDEVANDRGVADLLLSTIDEPTLRRALTHGIAPPKFVDPAGATLRSLLDHVAVLAAPSTAGRSPGDWFRAIASRGGTGGREFWWLAEWPLGELQIGAPRIEPASVDDSPVPLRSHVPSGRVNHIRLVATIARLAEHGGLAAGSEPMLLASLLDAAGYWPVEVMTSPGAPDDAWVVAGRSPSSHVSDPGSWGDHWVLIHTGAGPAVATTVDELASGLPWYTSDATMQTLGAFAPRTNAHVRPEPRGQGPAGIEWVWWNDDARPCVPGPSTRPPVLPTGAASGSRWVSDPALGWVLLGPDGLDELLPPSHRDDPLADGSPPPTIPPAPYDTVVWNDRRWVWTGATWRVVGSPPPLPRAAAGQQVTWLGVPWTFDGVVWRSSPTAETRPSTRHRWNGASWILPPTDESLADLLRDQLVVLDPGDPSMTPSLADAAPLPPLPEPAPLPAPVVEPLVEIQPEAEPLADDRFADEPTDTGEARDDVPADGALLAPLIVEAPSTASPPDEIAPPSRSTTAAPPTPRAPVPDQSSTRKVGVAAAVVLAVAAVIAVVGLLVNQDESPQVMPSSTLNLGGAPSTSASVPASSSSAPSSSVVSNVREPAYRTIPLLAGYEFNGPPVIIEDPASTQVTAGPTGSPSDAHLQFSWLALGDVTLSDDDARQLQDVIGTAASGRYQVVFQQVAGDPSDGGRYQAGFWFTTDPRQDDAPSGVHAPENRLRGLVGGVSIDETNETLQVFDGEFGEIDDSGVFATLAPRVRTLWIPYGDISFVQLSRFVRYTEPDRQPDFSDPASYTLQDVPLLLGGSDSEDVTVDPAGPDAGASVGGRHDGNTHWFFDSSKILSLVRTFDRCADDGSFWAFVAHVPSDAVELVVRRDEQTAILTPSDLPARPEVQAVEIASCG